VNPERPRNRPVGDCGIAPTGTVVHLEYGVVKMFRIISKDKTAEHWATNDLEMDELGRFKLAETSWKIEEYRRGLKQVTNVTWNPAALPRSLVFLRLQPFGQKVAGSLSSNSPSAQARGELGSWGLGIKRPFKFQLPKCTGGGLAKLQSRNSVTL